MADSSPDLKAFLLATPIFGDLSETGLDRLIAMLIERRADRGTTVVREGEPGHSMFVVATGTLTVSKIGERGRRFRWPGSVPVISSAR